MKKILIVVLGSTASGKTDLAIQLAKHFSTEIISSDSRQFYKEISIGTAKPSQDELVSVKHHLINNKSIHDTYNVGIYELEVLSILDELFKQHHVVIMVGGSGLYIQAVCEGFDDIPVVDENIRQEINKQFEQKGITYLQESLVKLDSVYAKKVDFYNPQRMKRALEICLATGKPFSSFHTGRKKERNFDIIKIGIDIEKEVLHERINNRVDQMIDAGLEEEAKKVFPFKDKNALQTVGYKELFEYFEKKMNIEEAIEKIKSNTRKYAKRQMTWFRKDNSTFWARNDNFIAILNHIDKFINKAHSNPL